jgi:hypothetical protein
MLFGLKITVSYSDSHFRSGALSYPSECVAYVWKGHMMIGAIAILVIMIAAVGTAVSAHLTFTPPKHVISGDSKQQDTLKNQEAELVKQQATQQQQAELEKRQAELERQQAVIERRAAQKKQTELVKQQATQQQQGELGKRQAELERQQFILEKRTVQILKAKLEKQQAELEKQLAELEKKLAELNKQEATSTAATSISCDAARQIITNLGFEDVKSELCTGDTFSFVAMRNGRLFSIEITAANGEVKEVPAEALVVVANQVRLQGHKCEKPSAVERDVFLSKPGLPVWVLTCDEGRYRAELVPHKQARVTRLD